MVPKCFLSPLLLHRPTRVPRRAPRGFLLLYEELQSLQTYSLRVSHPVSAAPPEGQSLFVPGSSPAFCAMPNLRLPLGDTEPEGMVVRLSRASPHFLVKSGCHLCCRSTCTAGFGIHS